MCSTTRLRRMIHAGIALALLVCVPLSAYVLNTFKWSSSEVPFYVNPANLDVPEAAVETALQYGSFTWTNQSHASFRFSYAGRTSATSTANDGKNEVLFRNASSGTAIATTYYWYSGARLLDADIIFWDGAYRFFTGTSGCSGGFYVEDIAAHEFGHALGIGHSTVGSATMYPSVGYCDNTFRYLDPDDLAAVEALYPPGGVQPPAAPTNLTATTSTSSVSLAWSDRATNEDRYLVERSAGAANWLQVAQVGVNATSFVDSGLTSGTYTYRVRASNSAGDSPYSNEVTATIAAPPPGDQPSVPSGPYPWNGATNVAAAPTLTWAPDRNAASFDVVVMTRGVVKWRATGLPSSSAQPTTLAGNTTYSWYVVARGASGQAVTGPTWTFKTVRAAKR